MTLSEDDFNRQCIEFVLKCEQYGDRSWCLSVKPPDGPMRRIMPQPTTTTPTTTASNYCSSGGSKFVLIRSEMKQGPNLKGICSYEHHVIYSESYEVPVMYFSVSDQSGAPRPMDELMSTEQRDLFAVVNQVEHPLLFRPFYMIHPCRTRDFMESHATSGNCSYLITWLSILANLLSFQIDARLGDERARGSNNEGNKLSNY